MTYQEGLNQIDKATQKISEAHQLIVDAIMNAILFTWQWWIALALLVVPWIIWGIFRDRKSTARIFSAGLLVMVLSEILDILGVSYGKWSYPVMLIYLLNKVIFVIHYYLNIFSAVSFIKNVLFLSIKEKIYIGNAYT